MWGRLLVIRSCATSKGIGRLLFVLDHDGQPLLEVLLHLHTAALQQILNALDFALQVLQLVVILLVFLLATRNLLLQLHLLGSPYYFAVVIDHAAHGVLASNLLDLVGKVFYLVAQFVDRLAQGFSPRVLFLKQRSVFLHGLVFAITFAEHFKGICSVLQVI